MSSQWRHLLGDVRAVLTGVPRLSDVPDQANLAALPNRDLIERTFALPDRAFQLHMLRNDPVYGRLSDQQKNEAIAKGIEIGCRYGAKMHDYESDWRQALRRYDIEYKEQSKPDTAERVVFAEYREPREITVYADTLDRYGRFCHENHQPYNLTPEAARSVLVGHELFHFLEYRDGASVGTRDHRVVTHRLGPFTMSTRLSSISEIAAMAFAKEWLGLQYSPNVYDVLFMQLYEPKAATLILRNIESGYESDIKIQEGKS